jgi:glutamate-1-semialdehyde 2,1-aminomutase
VGPTAAIATLRKHRARNVPAQLVRVGSAVQRAWSEAAEQTSINLAVSGIAPLAHFAFGYSNAQALRTLYTQLMLERGILSNASFYAMYAHTNDHVARFAVAVREVFSLLADALAAGAVEARIAGPVAHNGFARLT